MLETVAPETAAQPSARDLPAPKIASYEIIESILVTGAKEAMARATQNGNDFPRMLINSSITEDVTKSILAGDYEARQLEALIKVLGQNFDIIRAQVLQGQRQVVERANAIAAIGAAASQEIMKNWDETDSKVAGELKAVQREDDPEMPTSDTSLSGLKRRLEEFAEFKEDYVPVLKALPTLKRDAINAKRAEIETRISELNAEEEHIWQNVLLSVEQLMTQTSSDIQRFTDIIAKSEKAKTATIQVNTGDATTGSMQKRRAALHQTLGTLANRPLNEDIEATQKRLATARENLKNLTERQTAILAEMKKPLAQRKALDPSMAAQIENIAINRSVLLKEKAILERALSNTGQQQYIDDSETRIHLSVQKDVVIGQHTITKGTTLTLAEIDIAIDDAQDMRDMVEAREPVITAAVKRLEARKMAAAREAASMAQAKVTEQVNAASETIKLIDATKATLLKNVASKAEPIMVQAANVRSTVGAIAALKGRVGVINASNGRTGRMEQPMGEASFVVQVLSSGLKEVAGKGLDAVGSLKTSFFQEAAEASQRIVAAADKAGVTIKPRALKR